jgi:protoporphyrinogen oxidase
LNTKHAVIIGSGVAGLASALGLGRDGQWDTCLLEREDRPGGLARCLHFRGISTDLGPHRIHTEIPEVRQLIDEIATTSLYTVQRSSHIYLRGRFLNYPPSPVEMALRLGPHKLIHFAASYMTGTLGGKPARETYESLMCGAFGKALYEFLLKPYTEKTWKISAGQLHADTARVRVSAGSLAKMITRLFKKERKGTETALKEFHYVRGGVETLVGHLADRARDVGATIRLNREVQSLDIDPSSGMIRTVHHARADTAPRGRALQSRLTSREASPACDLQQENTDLVISTVPLPILLGKILPPLDSLADARSAAEGLNYLDMIFVLFIVNRKIISGNNWLYFPEPHLIFNRGYEAKSFDPEMAPGDRSVLCLEITVEPNGQFGQESDETILQRAREQITSTGLFRSEEIDEEHLYRLPYAYPLYTLDYDQRLDRVFNGLRTIRNLVTVGRQGLFNHNNMDHSIYMGLRAAETLNRHSVDQAAGHWYDQVDEFKRLRIVD